MPEPGAAPAKTKRQAQTHTILITVVGGGYEYSDQDNTPARGKRAHREDKVGWKSATGDYFEISFEAGKWPFQGNQQVFNSSSSGVILPRQLSKGAIVGEHYKYTVHMPASRLPDDDPDIIIDPCDENG